MRSLDQQKNNILLMPISFFVATLLTLLPLPHYLIWCRPQWLLVTLLFWIIQRPTRYGIFLALFSGLLYDTVSGTPLGLTSIVFVVVAYLVLKLYQIIAYTTRLQQACFVGVITGGALVLQSLLIAMVGHSAPVIDDTFSAVTSALIWPLFFYFL